MSVTQPLVFPLHTSKSPYEISPSERFHRDVNSIYAVPLYFTIPRALVSTNMPAPFYGGDSVRTYTEASARLTGRASFSRLLKGEFPASLLLFHINQQLSAFRSTVTIPCHCISIDTITQSFFIVKLKISFYLLDFQSRSIPRFQLGQFLFFKLFTDFH